MLVKSNTYFLCVDSPIIKEQSPNTIVLEGRASQLTCGFISYPISFITWVKNVDGIEQPIFAQEVFVSRINNTELAIHRENMISRRSIGNDETPIEKFARNYFITNLWVNSTFTKSVLNFVNITSNDEGYYQCLSINAQGTGRSLWINLVVHSKLPNKTF